MLKKEEHQRSDSIHHVKTLDSSDWDEFQQHINKAISECEYIVNRIIFFEHELRFACMLVFSTKKKNWKDDVYNTTIEKTEV